VSTYREIVGKKIKKVTSDPSAGLDGEMWYNSTTGTLRGLALSTGFASSGNLGTGRNNGGSAGTQTAGLYFAGSIGSGTEEYNGAGWAAGGNVNNSGEQITGGGTQTAALKAAGSGPNNTEEYNGTAWTDASATINTTRNAAGYGGTQTAGVIFGGNDPPQTTATEEYNGSSWTTVNAMTTARAGMNGGSGGPAQTAVLAVGGFLLPATNVTNTEEYDGTNWSNGGSLNTATRKPYLGGTSAAMFAAGGEPGKTNSENYDGSTWTASPVTLSTGRGGGGSAGTNTAMYAVTGGPNTTACEEYNSTTTVYTPAAYSALPNTPNSRNAEGAGSKNGSTTAAMNWCGGQPGPTGFTNTSVEWNGSAWSATPNYPQTARHVGGTGVEPAALGVAGFDSEGSNIDTVNEFDGSSWTGGGAYPLAQYSVATAGTQTAAITSGGGSNTTTSNDYNGSSWTGNPSMSSGRSFAGNAGTQTALIAMGGSNQPAGECEEFNGSSWTSGGNLASGYVSESTSTGGTQTAGMMCGANKSPGGSAGSAGYLQTYDGTSWITSAGLGTARNGASVSGTTTAHMIATGYGPSTYSNSAEEFTPASSATNIKNFATS
jgi:hypothetical protein